MVTPSSSSLYDAVRQAVRNDPTLSQRGVIRELRAQGHRFRDARARDLVVLAKRQTETERLRASGELEQEIRRAVTGLDDAFTFQETARFRQGRERHIRTVIRETFPFEFRGERGDSLSNFQYVLVEYSAYVTATVYIDGSPFTTIQQRFPGRIVTHIREFNQEFLAERIRQQIGGQIVAYVRERYSNISTNRINVDIESLRITVDRVQGRGGR